jgi:hypothetical protein
MIARVFAAFIAALVLTKAAAAENAPPQGGDARYTFHRVADGFVRLDAQTGEVALCSQHAVGWACVAAAEDRTVLENEIDRLRRENAALKRELLARGLPLPNGTLPEPSAGDNGGGVTVRLPDDADIARALAFVGRMWRHLVEAIANAQNQVLRKG